MPLNWQHYPPLQKPFTLFPTMPATIPSSWQHYPPLQSTPPQSFSYGSMPHHVTYPNLLVWPYQLLVLHPVITAPIKKVV